MANYLVFHENLLKKDVHILKVSLCVHHVHHINIVKVYLLKLWNKNAAVAPNNWAIMYTTNLEASIFLDNNII